jgi:hypothetical protein
MHHTCCTRYVRRITALSCRSALAKIIDAARRPENTGPAAHPQVTLAAVSRALAHHPRHRDSSGPPYVPMRALLRVLPPVWPLCAHGQYTNTLSTILATPSASERQADSRPAASGPRAAVDEMAAETFDSAQELEEFLAFTHGERHRDPA